MPSALSTQDLIDNVMRWLTTDVKDKSLELLVKDAIKDADRELRNVDPFGPVAWDIHPYDELRTITAMDISALTAADPGVITAASRDSDITGHGIRDASSYYHRELVTISDIDSVDTSSTAMDNLNGRTFIATYVNSTTFSLKTLDDLDAVDTTSYAAYSDGGAVYHAGFQLSTTPIEASLATAWGFDRIVSVTFDGLPATPISLNQLENEPYWQDVSYAGRPRRWRYWRNMTAAGTTKHYLFWYPVCYTEHQVRIQYKKNISDIDTWNASTYPFHPEEIHECIWHGALANLAGMSKRMERQSKSGDRLNVQVEVMFATKWIGQWELDKKRVLNLSRSMLGDRGGMGGISA